MGGICIFRGDQPPDFLGAFTTQHNNQQSTTLIFLAKMTTVFFPIISHVKVMIPFTLPFVAQALKYARISDSENHHHVMRVHFSRVSHTRARSRRALCPQLSCPMDVAVVWDRQTGPSRQRHVHVRGSIPSMVLPFF